MLRQLPGLRFSLRTLFLVVAFFSVACVALKFAGTFWWSILSGGSLLLLMAAAVVAFVGRGEQQASAIGFTVCAVIYVALLSLAGAQELDPYQGWMPTTRLLRPVFGAVATGKYVDLLTGREIPNYKPPTGGGMGMGGGMAMPGMPVAGFSETPRREDFMAMGHLLWAMLLALIGGRFAGFVFASRERTRGHDQLA